MNVRPFELDAPRKTGPSQPEQKDPRAEMQASPPGDADDQRAGESTDEPGYGHGV